MVYSAAMPTDERNPVTLDTELTITEGRQRAVLSPWGAALRRYYEVDAAGRETNIVWGYSGGNQKKGGQGDVLIPFPGRIAEGRYTFDGCTYQLERNDKEGPNAIHGFVRNLPWRVAEQTASAVRFEVTIDAAMYAEKGYPFSLSCLLTYRLEQGGLTCRFDVRNVGTAAAPVGIGFHPYFVIGVDPVDGAEVTIPARSYLAFNERLAPTGQVLSVDGSEWDYRRMREVGAHRFNHCYLHLDRDGQGVATAVFRNPQSGRTIRIAMDESFYAIVVYTGDAIPNAARQALAIEPMTCASDAFNHPEWGLRRLAPGETFSGRFSIHHESRG
ncbi:MAG: hypothetical protein U0172_13680 [Nitrospiraceae bacterium]